MMTQEERAALWEEFEPIYNSQDTPQFRPMARKYHCYVSVIQRQWERYKRLRQSESALENRRDLLESIAAYCPEIRQALSRPLSTEFVSHRPRGTASIFRKLSDFIIPNMVYSFPYLSYILRKYTSNTAYHNSPVLEHLISAEVKIKRREENKGYLLFDSDSLRKQAEQELGIIIPKGVRSLRSNYVFNKREEQRAFGNNSCTRLVVFVEPSYIYCVAPDNSVYFMVTTAADEEKNLLIFINELHYTMYITRNLRDKMWSSYALKDIVSPSETATLDSKVHFHVLFGDQEALISVEDYRQLDKYDAAHLPDRLAKTEVKYITK